MRRFLFKNYVHEGKTSAFASKPKAKNVWAASLAGLMFSVAILGLVPPSGVCSLNAHTGHGALGAPAKITPHAEDKVFYTTTAGLAVKKQNNTLYTTLNGQVYTVLGQGDGGSTYYIDGYIQKEYLESSRTQYINTGYLSDTRTDAIEIRYQFSEGSGGARIIAGYNNGTSGTKAPYEYWYKIAANSHFQFQYQATGKSGISHGYGTSFVSGIHTVRRDKAELWGDGVKIGTLDSTQFSTSRATVPYGLFARICDSAGTAIDFPAEVKIYHCKIWDNGVLVRDFVPVQCPCKKSVGMYDKVNKILYENAGTGDFIVGPNAVPSEVLSAPVYDNFSYASDALSESLPYRTVEGFEMVGGVERGYLLCQSQTGGNYLKLRI